MLHARRENFEYAPYIFNLLDCMLPEIDLRSTKISVTCRLPAAVNAIEPGCYVTDTLILASY